MSDTPIKRLLGPGNALTLWEHWNLWYACLAMDILEEMRYWQ